MKARNWVHHARAQFPVMARAPRKANDVQVQL